MHYTKKYSPIPAAASFRILLATTPAKDGELRHCDAEQAFLKTNIVEDIYIEIREKYQEFPGAVGLLNKVIHGLVQARSCRNNKFCDDMTAIEFEQSKAEQWMFRQVTDEEVEMVVVARVDDILTHVKSQATMERFATELGRKFNLKDMGDVKHYMGGHITRNRKARKLKLGKYLYVKSMVERFGLNNASRIPASSGVPTLSKANESQAQEEEENMLTFPYQKVLGALMRTATMTPPDIACAVRAVATFYENPRPAHGEKVVFKRM